jgi:hypothetical protein
LRATRNHRKSVSAEDEKTDQNGLIDAKQVIGVDGEPDNDMPAIEPKQNAARSSKSWPLRRPLKPNTLVSGLGCAGTI